jgi:hypothetical protein
MDQDQGILNEVWKNKLIFVETPDANETSIALENYRRVGMKDNLVFRFNRLFRHVTTVVEQCSCQSPEARFLRVLILITIMGALSSCLGKSLPTAWSRVTPSIASLTNIPRAVY